MNNKTYDTLKWVALVFLPALGGFYFGLSDLWNLPKALEVVGTISLIDTFLGLLLGVNSRTYRRSERWFDGVATVAEDHPDYANKDRIVFKLNKVPVHNSALDEPVPEMDIKEH